MRRRVIETEVGMNANLLCDHYTSTIVFMIKHQAFWK